MINQNTPRCLTLIVFGYPANVYMKITHWLEAYVEPSGTSTVEYFCEKRLTVFSLFQKVNHFCKKAASQMFDGVLNTPLVDLVTYL